MKAGVELVLEGDHVHHEIPLGIDDLQVDFDAPAITYIIHLDERDAEDLYWNLLEIIPKLRKDRR